MHDIILDSDLENITGGAGTSGYHFSGQVNPTACIPGQYYYVVSHSSYFYGQAEGITQEDGKTLLELRCTAIDGRPCVMHFRFNVEIINVYTTLAVDC